MSSTSSRQTRRETFNTAAAEYHKFRPRYPASLLDALAAQLGSGSKHILEIGPATGVATETLAARGWQVTAVELGRELAEAASGNLADVPSVEILHANFDDWEPSAATRYDAVIAATAWHWLDPDTRYQRAHRWLKSGGTLAFWSANHVFPEDGDPLFLELQPVYDRLGESLPGDGTLPRPGELRDYREEIEASGLFDDVQVRHFDWEISYAAEDYIGLLGTFSGHISMPPSDREHLFAEIRHRVAARNNQPIRRHWGAALHTATRREVQS